MAIKVTTENVGNALALLAIVEPQALAAYQLARTIWLSVNPGKTEADFINTLDATSAKTTNDSDEILVAKGFVRDAAGNWSKPPQP